MFMYMIQIALMIQFVAKWAVLYISDTDSANDTDSGKIGGAICICYR